MILFLCFVPILLLGCCGCFSSTSLTEFYKILQQNHYLEYIIDSPFFIVILFSWVAGKMKTKNMKIYNTIQNSNTVMHFLDQNLTIKNGEQLKHRNIMNEIFVDLRYLIDFGSKEPLNNTSGVASVFKFPLVSLAV